MVRVKKSSTKRTRGKKKGLSAVATISISLLFITAIALLYRSSTKSYDREQRLPITQKEQPTPHKDVEPPKEKSIKEQSSVEKESPKSSEKSASTQNASPQSASPQSASLELPYYSDSTYLIRNRDGRYTLLYSTTHKQALWVAYTLTSGQVAKKGADRKNNFVKDPKVVLHNWESASDSDYRGSGYDRGHLLPSADRDDSEDENNSTFLFSNISPQLPQLNRVVWNSLERKVRAWAAEHDSLYIVTGGILSGDAMGTIGKGKVTVPNHFFKAILAPSGGSYKAVGFIMPNRKDISRDIFEYIIPIDSIESRTGFDLFTPLDDKLEERIESLVDINFWR